MLPIKIYSAYSHQERHGVERRVVARDKSLIAPDPSRHGNEATSGVKSAYTLGSRLAMSSKAGIRARISLSSNIHPFLVFRHGQYACPKRAAFKLKSLKCIS